MEALRTPDAHFEGLPDYAFEPHYLTVGEALRLHYVNEGPKTDTARPVLMMHGEPSWSYLYRHMIPKVVAAGARVIAPDLIGFGKSDKPRETSDYSYARHVAWMSDWFEQMDFEGVVLVCQDWGGLLGLRLVAAYPDRFAGVVAANTFLPIGNGKPSEAFLNWREFSQTVPEFPAGRVLQGATVRELSESEVAAYDAPFPDESFKAGARIFPALVPTELDDRENHANRLAWEVLESWDKPFVTAFSDQDPITRGGDRQFQTRIPGCSGQPHTTLKGGGHFLQEDVPDAFADVVIDLLGRL